NNSLVLTVGSSIASGSTVIVNYTQGLYPIVGLSNNKVAAFSHTVGTSSSGGSGGGSTVSGPPALKYISVSGSTVLLKYDENLNSSSTPGTFQYYVQVNGRANTVRSVTISGDTVLLNMAESMTTSDNIYVTYY